MQNLNKKLFSNELLYQRVGINFFTRYKFGKLTKFYNRIDEIKSLTHGNNFIKGLKNKYRGERCFIIGNGPSLNNQDLTLLKNEFTIGSNYIYMNYEKMGFYPTIFTIVNYLVAEQRIDEINNLPESIKIFPYFLNYIINEDERTFFLNSAAIKEFSIDLTKNISWQSTVTFFNMQLAYYLGFDEVYLIGVDNNYIQPENGKEGAMIEQEEDDPNHFCNTYFKGLTWQKADTDAMEYVYYLTKDIFDQSEQNIYNATHGGKLEVFERVKYEELFQATSNFSTKNKIILKKVNEEKKNLISINPDLENVFGHYLHYDQCISDCLSDKNNIFILSNKNISEDLIKPNKNIIPSFKNKSWNIGLPEQRTKHMDEIFKVELLNAISIIENINGDKIFYFYTGSLNHAEIIYDLIIEYNLGYKFHINLFREHFNIDYIQKNKATVLELIDKISQIDLINLYIDSDEMNQKFYDILNIKFDRWTMFPITNFNLKTKNILENKNNNYLKVVFPGNLRIEKGYDLTVKCANELSKLNLNVYIRSTLINVNNKEISKLLIKIEKDVNIVEGVLSEDEYLAFMKYADIVILPYRISEFKTRTSGLMADAIYLSKPVVAAQGTWMGDIVEKYENGIVFDDGDINSLVNAVISMKKNIDYYNLKAENCSKLWMRNNNVNKLINDIFNLEVKNEK